MNQLDLLIETAVREGILPPNALVPSEPERPWPVVILTAIGAWLAAIPMLAALFMLIGEAVFRSPGAYVIGMLGVGASVTLLRSKALPLFVEQLAVPALLTGGLALGIGLMGDLPREWGAAAMAIVCLGTALLIPQPWMRTLLGAAACAFAVMASGTQWNDLLPSTSLYSLLGVSSLWLLMQWLPEKLSLPAHKRAALASVADGWLLAALTGLALWSGMTFLAGASIDPFAGQSGHSGGPSAFTSEAQLASVLFAAAAVAWLGRSWPSLRQAWCLLAAIVVLTFAWPMPSLGAVLLLLAVCATQGRWRLAATAGLAAAWIVGAFYYQLAFPLATKALIMVVAGAVLGALAWLALRNISLHKGTSSASADSPRARLGIAVCAVAVLVVANVGIWQKQKLIAEGKPVFVELGPVDPRSLMQGDYMRLAFRLPQFERSPSLRGARRPFAVGKIDARGIATLDRVVEDADGAPGEIAIELTPNARGWTLATDAWHFAEGEAGRWERAKYGEFRVAPDGRTLLVGMRGAALEPL